MTTAQPKFQLVRALSSRVRRAPRFLWQILRLPFVLLFSFILAPILNFTGRERVIANRRRKTFHRPHGCDYADQIPFFQRRRFPNPLWARIFGYERCLRCFPTFHWRERGEWSEVRKGGKTEWIRSTSRARR